MPYRGRSVIDGIGTIGCAGHYADPKTLRDGREQQRRFHRREIIADALARTAAEGKIRKTRQALHQIAFPTLRPKFQWRVEPSRIAMHDPLRQRNAAALRNRIAGDFRVFDRHARHAPRRADTGASIR